MTMLRPGVCVDIRGATKDDVQAVIDKCLELGAIRMHDCGSESAYVKWSPHSNGVWMYKDDDGYPVITIDQALGRAENDIDPFKPIADCAKDFAGKAEKIINDAINDNGWYERGELPPVGVECEYLYEPISQRYGKCKIAAINGIAVAFTLDDFSNTIFVSTMERAKFRPIKTERDLFIERFMKQWHGKEDMIIYEFVGDQYDKGLRYTE